MADEWPEVPEEELYRARLPDGTIKALKHLCIGDVYQQVDCDGEQVPFEALSMGGVIDGSPYPLDQWARVETDPVRNHFVGRGWFVNVTIGPLAQFRN